jgi:hypothetical protein
MITALLFVLVLLLLMGDSVLSDPALGHSAQPSGTALRRAYDVLLALAVVGGGTMLARTIWRTMTVPPAWDVQAFWAYGHAAALGLNPYLPASFHAFPLPPGPLPSDFIPEVIDVGCVYPPPSLLFIAPMGLLPLGTAAVVWVGAWALCLVACIVLLWRTFFPSRGGRGLALAAALTCLWPATIATFQLGQTNFLALLFVLAAWRTRERPVSAVSIAGAALVKPVYHILWLYPLLRARWRTLAVGAGVVVALCLVSVGVFGVDTFVTYFRDSPLKRNPGAVFAEPGNASLLGAILRFSHYAPAGYAPDSHLTSNPVFLAAAGVVLLVTVWAVLRIPRTREGTEHALATLIPAGLLIYPATGANYSVVLLAPLCYLWSRHATDRASALRLALLIALLYPITRYHGDAYAVAATALVWVTLVVLATRGTASR